MKRQRFLHHACRAAVLLGFAYFILYLNKTGSVMYYIAPRMTDYVKWSAVCLYAVGVYQVYRAVILFREKDSDAACGCGAPAHFRLRSLLLYGFFAFPLLVGFAMPDALMGSALAAKKGVNLPGAKSVTNDSAARAQAAAPAKGKSPDAMTENELRALFPADKFAEPYAKLARRLYQEDVIAVREELFMETLASVDMYLDRFAGKKMELSGFVFREPNMKDNQLIVARFALQCCSADAAPYGILVESGQARAFADDAWVKATGTIQKSRYNDLDILSVKAEKLEKIDAPKSAYVYPNAEFGR